MLHWYLLQPPMLTAAKKKMRYFLAPLRWLLAVLMVFVSVTASWAKVDPTPKTAPGKIFCGILESTSVLVSQVAQTHWETRGPPYDFALECSLAAKTIPNPAAGEDLFVGLYGQTRRANIQSGLNATHTPHHVVQDAVSGTSHSLGVTINLRRDLHELTRTFGRNADLGSNTRNLAADVRDLRNILRDAGYDRSLVNQQMQRLIELNRQVGNVPP